MCLILRATINKNIMQEEEAVKDFFQAGRVILELEKTNSNVQLMQNVFKEIDETKKIYHERTGHQLDIEALADEAEADEAEDNSNSIEMMWITNPLLMSVAVIRA